MAEYDITKQCILCGLETEPQRISRSEWGFNCKFCGPYIADAGDEPYLESLPDNIRIRISGLVRETSEISAGRELFLLNSETVPILLTRSPNRFDVPQRGKKLLQAIARSTRFPGQSVPLVIRNDANRAYGSPKDLEDFIYIVQYLISSGFVTAPLFAASTFELLITPAGWEELQRSHRLESLKAFVAMWYHDSVNDAYERGMALAIKECGFDPVIIRAKEYNGDIVDQVIAEINESRFIVADVTGHRNGVYFEAGYAQGLGLEVIWTCRDDDAKNTHFDAEHFNQIRWKDFEDLRTKLSTRIRATILAPVGAH